MNNIKILITDGCPNCLQRHNQPLHVKQAAATITGTYRCSACLWSWRTTWDRDSIRLEAS